MKIDAGLPLLASFLECLNKSEILKNRQFNFINLDIHKFNLVKFGIGQFGTKKFENLFDPHPRRIKNLN